MKKILSIILALGLVLGMSLVAMPVLADEECDAAVTVTPPCAGYLAEYCIEFESKYQMLAGNDKFVIQFPEGTTFGATVTATVDGAAATAVLDGLLVTVGVPANIDASATVVICIDGVKNPDTPDYYTLNVWVDMLCCPLEQIDCGEYEIVPAVSTYKFVVDFGPSYPGIAEDIWPPLQACEVYDFNLIIKTDKLGCAGWGDTEVWAHLKPDAPGEVTFNGTAMEECEKLPLGTYDLGANVTIVLPLTIHAHTPSEDCQHYVINFHLEGEIPAPPCEEPGIREYEKEYMFKAYQDLDSFLRPEFGPKWNFFSTPLRLFDDAIDSVFEPVEANLVSVRYYDNVQGKWFGYDTNSSLPAEYQSLNTIEDGKGYLVRMKTTNENWNPALNGAMWLFGHAEAYAPEPPFTYNVAKGWTMMGYTNLADPGDAADYLLPAAAIGGGILGLSGNAYVPVTQFVPGFGYWVHFAADGQVVPGSPVL